MFYIKSEEKIVNLHGLKKAFPKVSLPKNPSNAWLLKNDILPVVYDDTPNVSIHQKLEQLAGEEKDGVWLIGYNVTDKTLDEIKSEYESAIQNYLDSTAQAHGYDGIKSAVGYANVTVDPSLPDDERNLVQKFVTEGKAFAQLQAITWAKAYIGLNDVKSGARALPTLDELIGELPVFEKPE